MIWEPIQAIRRRYDRNIGRWMPHITMLYPFVPREMFDQDLLGRLAVACRGAEPFDVALERFRHFRHGRGSFTIWLDPQPVDAINALQQLLWGQFPDYDDLRAHTDGFQPHLSVGQIKGDDRCPQIQQELQVGWAPIAFTADRVALIWRNEPPDDIFLVYKEIILGSGEVVDPGND